MISADSVRVSWDDLDIPEITGYNIVYYSQRGNIDFMNVSMSTNSVVISGLMSNVEYQFQVVALAGSVSFGERSFLKSVTTPMQPG